MVDGPRAPRKAPAKKAAADNVVQIDRPPRKRAAKKAPAKKAAPRKRAAELVAEVMNNNQVDVPQVDLAYEAHKKRMTGMSWAEINETMPEFGSEENAAAAVNVFLQRAALTMSHELGQLALTQELLRLDELQKSWWLLANMGDKDAARTVLDIMKLRGSYLKLANTDKITEKQTIIITDTGDMAMQLQRMVEDQNRPALPPGP